VTGAHNDFARREPSRPEPSRQEPGRLRLSRIIVPTNMVLAGLLSVLSFSRVVGVTDISVYLGTIFLIGALVPSNLLRFERFARGRKTRALARLRRPMGISAGIWFVVHSVVSVWEFFDMSLPLLPQFTRTGIVLGLVATMVFVAMLLTSTDRAQRALGRNWKRLHRLVWFTVPLTLAHAILAGGIDSPSNVLYLGIMAFAGFEYRALRKRGAHGTSTHMVLIGAGVFAAALIYVVL
jgi:DMSO/TMAO reductase YedYZ heme-binding membrane subunit